MMRTKSRNRYINSAEIWETPVSIQSQALSEAPLHLWIPKMDSWQNSTSKWWSKKIPNFYFFVWKNNFENENVFFWKFYFWKNFKGKSYFSFEKKWNLKNFQKKCRKFHVFFSKMILFDEKIKVGEKIGLSFRYKIL